MAGAAEPTLISAVHDLDGLDRISRSHTLFEDAPLTSILGLTCR